MYFSVDERDARTSSTDSVCQRFKICQVRFDRWFATQLANLLKTVNSQAAFTQLSERGPGLVLK